MIISYLSRARQHRHCLLLLLFSLAGLSACDGGADPDAAAASASKPASADSGTVRSEYPILTEINERVRDLKVDQQGAVYILTQPGKLYRLWREKETSDAQKKTLPGAGVYDVVCSGCHAVGANAAPRLSQPQQWQRVLQQPTELTYKHVIEGYLDMPERGLCYQCSDAELIATTDYMLEQVQAAAAETAAKQQ